MQAADNPCLMAGKSSFLQQMIHLLSHILPAFQQYTSSCSGINSAITTSFLRGILFCTCFFYQHWGSYIRLHSRGINVGPVKHEAVEKHLLRFCSVLVYDGVFCNYPEMPMDSYHDQHDIFLKGIREERKVRVIFFSAEDYDEYGRLAVPVEFRCSRASGGPVYCFQDCSRQQTGIIKLSSVEIIDMRLST